MDREPLLAEGMLEPESMRVAGLTLRPFSYGTMLLAHMLKLTLITEGDDRISEAEIHRQVCTYAWMQAVPKDEVVRAIREAKVEERVLEFALGIEMESLEHLQQEIARTAMLIGAATVRAQSRYSGSEGDAPGKS